MATTVNNPRGGAINVIGPGSVVSGSVVAGHWPCPADLGPVDGRRWRVWVDHAPVTGELSAVDAADEFVYQAANARPDAHVEIKPEGGGQW